jgi:ketosteroid isomerase-like protein
MTQNEEIITAFYTAFQQKDVTAMQASYGDNATFSDAVFKDLSATEVRAMWEMLVAAGKDMELKFSNVKGTAQGGSADWVATYTFSRTGKKVINRIHAEFVIENGKITKHTDHFNFYKWAKQSLGTTGLLLGWTSTVRNKVMETAKNNLAAFMKNKQA